MTRDDTASPRSPASLDDDFAARLAAATPGDTAKGLFFNSVLAAVENLIGEDARDRCHRASGGRTFIEYINYPIAQYLPMVLTAVKLLAPELGSEEKAFFQLGYRAIEDFLGSGIGKTLLMLAGNDPTRVLAAAPSAYKTAVSYGERWLEHRGDRLVLVVRRDFMPASYHVGVLVATLEQVGVPSPVVRGRQVALLDAEYEMLLTTNRGKS